MLLNITTESTEVTEELSLIFRVSVVSVNSVVSFDRGF